MNRTVVVFDAETIPDLQAAVRMLALPARTPRKTIREALRAWQRASDPERERFLPPPLHQIAVLGALITHKRPEGWEMEKVVAPYVEDNFSEADLIAAFHDDVLKKFGTPRLVGFNTNTFDLPAPALPSHG